MEKKQPLFIKTLGDSPKARVLFYLIWTREMDICLTDLARNSKVSRATLLKMWKSLIKDKILIHIRDIGRAKMFKLNEDDLKIKQLISLYKICLDKETEIGLANQKIEIPA